MGKFFVGGARVGNSVRTRDVEIISQKRREEAIENKSLISKKKCPENVYNSETVY